MSETVIWRALSKAEADIVIASLADAGIPAYAMGALDRSFAPMGQVSIFVDEADRDDALAVLIPDGAELAAEDDGMEPISRDRAWRAGMVLLAAYIVVPISLLVTAALAMGLIDFSR